MPVVTINTISDRKRRLEMIIIFCFMVFYTFWCNERIITLFQLKQRHKKIFGVNIVEFLPTANIGTALANC